MEPVSLMGIFALVVKGVITVISVVGVASGMNWMNKKTFTTKKGGEQIESEPDTEKFHRKHI